jgi:ABC-type nitrate/sulfonate/bicarbonate transport system substrate-binding protein
MPGYASARAVCRPRAVLAATLLLGILACSAPASVPSRATPGGAPAAAAAQPATTATVPTPAPALRVRYAYTAIAGSMASMWIANDLGVFAKHGVEPELFYAPSTQTIQAVLSGETDFGLMSVRTLVEAHLAGADAIGVAVLTNKIVQSMFGGTHIHSLAELRDRRIGITRYGSIVHNSAKMLLRSAGLNGTDDVVMIQLGGFPEILAGLQGGATDAGLLSPPFTLAARKAGYRELGRLQDLPFEYANVVLVTRKGYVEANAEATRRTVRAFAEATSIFKRDAEATRRVMASYLRTDDQEVIAETYALNAEVMEPSLKPSAEGLEAVFAEVGEENPAALRLAPTAVIDARWSDELARDRLLNRLGQ